MFTLRPYQHKLKEDIYREWQNGHQNVLAVMPTGTGKTVTFCSIALDALQSGTPTVIAVHRTELVEQISLTLSGVGITHNIIAPRPVIVGIVGNQRLVYNKQFYDYNSSVTVVSVDTLNARAERHEQWAKKIKLWIIDEAAHVLKDNKWGRAAALFPHARGLGVTATPQRLDKRGLGRHADGVFDVMVEGPTSKWAIDNGFLCSYKVACPISDYKDHLKKATEGSDYSKESMKLASLNSTIIGDVVKSYHIHAKGMQAILFSCDISEGMRMESEFGKVGVPAKLLTGETDIRERRQALIAYRDRKIQVLINVDLFDEGLDVPGIECVIMARPTMSLAKYLQMIGRGLRPAKGKPYLTIIDHVGNVAEHKRPDLPRKWTLDRIIKRHDKTNLMRICNNYMCNAPYDRILTECPYCGTEPMRYSRAPGEPMRTLEQVDGDLFLLDPEQLEAMEKEHQLEDPADLMRRVARATGSEGIARKARDQQRERIEVAKELSAVIAQWAGERKREGLGDRSINKAFYLHFSLTISGALSQTASEMRATMQELITGWNVRREMNEARTENFG